MSFAEADRIVEAVGRGANLRESCEKTGNAYGTVRKWISAGRRDPEGTYGAWVRRLDAAKVSVAAKDAGDHHGERHQGPGPVEARVDALVSDCELNRQVALAAAQAKTLARAIDELGSTPGGAAKQALVSASRRLEELTPLLDPGEDLLDQLRRQGSTRRGARPIDHWKGRNSNGKGSGEVEIERGSEW